MGSVEDNEPLTKRMKASSGELRSLPNNLSITEPFSSLGDAMARPLPSQGGEELVGSKGVIKKVELVRIITKTLYSLGYERSGMLLEEESGIPLHSALVSLFRKQVLDGNWEESLDTLQKLGLRDENVLKSASFLILEQKFSELLESERVMDALKTLRLEISPLGVNKKRVHELSGCIASPSQGTLLESSTQDIVSLNSRSKLLEKLQELLPHTIMIPERRLEHLVEQALRVQKEACFFHNSMDGTLSLYSDHQCGRDLLPSQTLQVKEDGGVSLRHTLTGHQKTCLDCCLESDDHQILTCGIEESVRRWGC
ncbi:WD repeat-containing protein 26 isoform X1 [Cinnamomum micranthum f. kanehirae]|uniref:WD repeat-containing protein 26 isoform X1 n=1 Tax=Cinnamomum micranthum f. kanehirae TaxID=337451 RepID=A0A443PD56_9MAGN|nr:WD repeat-containing protein 26 isoform X1 [Cinnamomum micranthum f. kanehirae]